MLIAIIHSIVSDSSGDGRDCRKIVWSYSNGDKNQYFYWSGYGNWGQCSVTYTNVILN